MNQLKGEGSKQERENRDMEERLCTRLKKYQGQTTVVWMEDGWNDKNERKNPVFSPSDRCMYLSES